MTKHTTEEPHATYSKSRVEALSDGIFAIVLTLLVLELKVPQLPESQVHSSSALAHMLIEAFPKFASWVVSYLVLAIIWQNHHRLLDVFRHVTKPLFWANALLLMGASFIPFPTALWGEYPNNPLAVSLYGVTMIVVTLFFLIIRMVAHRDPGLLKPDYDFATFKRGTAQVTIFGCGVYLLGAVVSWWSPLAATLVYIAISIHFFLPGTGR